MLKLKRYNLIVLIAQVSPISAILGLFLIVPIVTIIIVSFWDYSEFMLLPDFVWTNYYETLTSFVTYKTYLNTFKYTILTWFFTLLIGFPVAYFLCFHVRRRMGQIVLCVICTFHFCTQTKLLD